jgi:hypothetical protein
MKIEKIHIPICIYQPSKVCGWWTLGIQTEVGSELRCIICLLQNDPSLYDQWLTPAEWVRKLCLFSQFRQYHKGKPSCHTVLILDFIMVLLCTTKSLCSLLHSTLSFLNVNNFVQHVNHNNLWQCNCKVMISRWDRKSKTDIHRALLCIGHWKLSSVAANVATAIFREYM